MLAAANLKVAFCTLSTAFWLACAVDTTCVHSQQAESASSQSVPDCAAFLNNTRKLTATSQDMLNQVREERKRVEKMRHVLGENFAEDLLVHLSSQESRLEQTLLEVESVQCPPSSDLTTPRKPR
jgi:hypothetical protein